MRRIVIDLFRVQRLHDADVVRDFAGVRKQRRNFQTRLTAFLKLAERPARLEFHVLQLRELVALSERLGKRLAVDAFQLRLEIKRLEMRWPAGHAEMNDALRANRKMR